MGGLPGVPNSRQGKALGAALRVRYGLMLRRHSISRKHALCPYYRCPAYCRWGADCLRMGCGSGADPLAGKAEAAVGSLLYWRNARLPIRMDAR